METRKVLWRVGLTGTILLVGFAVAFLLSVAKPKPFPQDAPAPMLPVVDVLTVAPAEQRLTVLSQGTVTARRQIDLVAQVSGVITEVAPSFAAGGFFDRGRQLLQIDPADYELALIQARGRLADAERALAMEQGLARQAKREWRDLGNREANDLFLRKPQLKAAAAAVDAARADVDGAELALERTHIKAPFNGRVLETLVDLGQFVTAGTPIARYYSIDTAEVRLPLTDRQLALLDLPLRYQGNQLGEAVPVVIRARFGGEQWQWRGAITRTDASIAVDSRMLHAVVEIPEPFAAGESGRPPLMVGQYVEAAIAGKPVSNVVMLPRDALRKGTEIWILDTEDRIVPMPVTVLQSLPDKVAVQAAFADELRVVVSPSVLAVAGTQVRPHYLERVAESGL